MVDIKQVAKTGGTVVGVFQLIKLIGGAIVAIVLSIIMLLIGVPWYFVVPFLIFVIVIIVLQIIKIKRIATA